MESPDRTNLAETSTDKTLDNADNASDKNKSATKNDEKRRDAEHKTDETPNDAARQTDETSLRPLTDEDFEDWDYVGETFAEKLKKIPAFFSWKGQTTAKQFAVAVVAIFGAALLAGVFAACAQIANLNQTAAGLFGLLGVASGLGACLTFLVVSARRYRDAGLFAWDGTTTRKNFFLASFQNIGKMLAWSAAFFLSAAAMAETAPGIDELFPFCLFVAVLLSLFALFVFGIFGATLAIGQAATRFFRDAGSFSWLGRATRQDFLLAHGDYFVATLATATPCSLLCAPLFVGCDEEPVFFFLLPVLGGFVSSLLWSPLLFAAAARRLRELDLNPWAALLYLVVPAPYMSLILVTLGPAPSEEAKTRANEVKETSNEIDGSETPEEINEAQGTEENADV